MRLLYLIDEIVIKGGTEKHLWDLAHGMSERGHQVTVVSLWNGPFGDLFQKSESLNYLCLGVRRIYGFNGIIGFFKLISIIRNSNIEIVQTFHTAADLIGPLASFLSGRKIITISSRRDLGYTKASKHIIAQRVVNLFVNKIICNSIEVQKQAIQREKIDSYKTTIIYNGIETQPFTDISQKNSSTFIDNHTIPKKGFYIGTVANLRMLKGIQVLLGAARILLKEYPSMFFLVAGDGQDRRQLEELAKKYEISANVFFIGWIEDVPSFLACLHIYVQPSLTEGFSNSVLEAMAAGLPIIATKVGGNKEIINHEKDGVLAKPNDSNAIVKAINLLFHNEEKRKEIAEAGRIKILSSYTLSQMLDRYESFYLLLKNKA